MKNFIQNGEVIEVAAPAAVASGDLVVVGSLIGVAVKAAASGEMVAIQLEGVFDLPKAAGAVAVGDKLYFDPVAKVLTKTSSNYTLLAVAVAAAANGDAKVRALLPGHIG